MPKKNNQSKVICKWIIPCANSIIDGDSNSLSLNSIIEEFSIETNQNELKIDLNEIKNVSFPFDLVVYWQRKNEIKEDIEENFLINLVDPNGKILISDMKGQVKMEVQHQSFRSRFKLNGLPITGVGKYKFVVLDDAENVITESSFFVKIN